MENKSLNLVIVVVLGAVIAVAVASKKSADPLLKEMLAQQSETQAALSRIAGNLGDTAGNPDANSAVLLSRLKLVEQRVSLLEAKLVSAGQPFNVPAQQAGPPPEDPNQVYIINVDHSPVRGKKDAPVTIVEFADFQCPFCARFHPPILDVLKEYPGKVNYIVKNFPLSFHPQARPAAKAAFAAGEQGKYFEMVDLLLANNSALSESKFEELAKELGLNVDKFKKDFKDKDTKWEAYITADMDLGQEVDVRGTPTFYINGKKTRARDLPSYKREIDALLNN